uniref:Zinc finger CCCH-type containing 7B n=3 Tax=Nothobranchius korthausae TaxID=1143690 RepID=A0A1A8FRE0_9TELE
MGKYEEGVEDCNNALVVCKESRRALYRKALCLKELSRYVEAYDCTSVCLLSNPQDQQVNELERDLAVQLKMKIRKPYVSSKVALFPLGNGPSVVAPDSSHSVPSTPPSSSQPAGSVVPDRVEDLELVGDDLDILLDSLSSEQGLTGAEFSDQTDNRMPTSSHTVPSILPAPTPQLPPAFFSSPISQLNCLDSFLTADSGPAATTLNVLDDLFTSGAETASDAPNFVSASMTLDALDSLDSLDDILDGTPSAVAAKEPEMEQDVGVKPLDLLDEPSSGGGGGKPKGGGGKSLDMKMKFVCAQCWRGGLISEPDKALKYCNAKARHTWTKDRRVLLVKSPERSKWVQVRPLPHAKNPPLYYDMCAQILEKRKCNYTGNCTFAHSQEEREMWMYMKNNDLRDMQQVYDMWLALTAQSRPADGATFSQPSSEEKFIAMPTDYAESGLHCRLCGKNSNSERQWQQHISSEKHKDRVFSCEGEDEALTWSYRFPGTRFEICPKAEAGCPDGASCDFAHSRDELREWIERRDFLRQKLAKARDDMLIMPDEFDFGKFNFLLQD